MCKVIPTPPSTINISKERYALDSTTQPKLLVDLWDVEEMIENEEPIEALKRLQRIIEEVRYSNIIDSYTLID